MDSLREKIAMVASGYSEDFWRERVKKGTANDMVVLSTYRERADEILAIPEIAEALRLKPIKTMPVRP